MPQVYFHCSNPKEDLIDRRGAAVDDLTEARDYAASVVRSLTMTHSLKDWRDWVLHVSDDLGDELFAVPFRARQAAMKVAMLTVQSRIAPLRRCMVGIKRRCSKLIATACHPYRPERHYMRGPGPKWFAKHGAVSIGRSFEPAGPQPLGCIYRPTLTCSSSMP